MEAQQSLDRLHLHNDSVGDNQIEPIPRVELKTFVLKRQGDLSADRQSPQDKLMREAGFLGGFEQARSERAVNLQAGVDDVSRNRVSRR